MKGFLFSIMLLLAYSVQSQTFEMRLTNNGSGVIGVQMRETSGNPPTTNDLLADLVFAISWPNSYGVSLNPTITTSYNIKKSGTEGVNGGTRFQEFYADGLPIAFPTNWVVNQWVTIMTISNNLAGSGTGTFSLYLSKDLDIAYGVPPLYDIIYYYPSNAGAAENVLIGTPQALSLSTTQVNVSCNGGSDGSIDLTVTGGVGPFTYNWGVGQPTTQDRSGLTAGTYTVTVTDAMNATASTSATITQPAALSLGTTQMNVSCFGGTNGSIDLTVTGGTPGYTYSWTGGATTEDRSGLSAGTYTVTVTDNKNCQATTSATITQPAALSLSKTQVNVSCNGGNNGSIDLTVTGGTGGYTYNWGVGQPTTQDRTGLAAGTYTVTVTDANSCNSTISATITQPSALSLNKTQVNVSCNGGNNGSIDLTVTGGTGGYTYDWGGGVTTEDRTGLAAGTYTVTVTDANSCQATTSATITQPSALNLSTSQVNVPCNGGSNGSIDLVVTGGTFPYGYNWGGGITTEDRTGLTAGTYTVTVTDNKNCQATTSATITQPAALNLSTTTVGATCGQSNGSIDLTVTGGTGAKSYNWGVGQPTTEDRTGLAGGTYTVTVTDANNCTATISATVTSTSAPTASISGNLSFCTGGSTMLTASGGGTYAWSTMESTAAITVSAGGTYTVTVTANGCTATASATVNQLPLPMAAINGTLSFCTGGNTTLTASGGGTYLWNTNATTAPITVSTPGTYTVVVTGANGCTASVSAAVSELAVPSASISGTLSFCPGGSTTLTASGGGTYAWSTNVNTAMITVNAPGTYTVVVTAANGCTASTSATVAQSPAMSLNLAVTDVDCNGGPIGAIDLTVTGGTGAKTYLWNTNATTEDLTGLTIGTYTVVVTDAANCTASASATVKIDLSNAQPLNIVCPNSVPALAANASCQATISDYTGLALITGGCGGMLNPIVQMPAPGTISNPGTVVIKLTASNSAGETATCLFNVSITGGCN